MKKIIILFSLIFSSYAFTSGRKTTVEVSANPINLGSFRRIPEGKFTMGSPRGESDRSSNENQVPVEITKAFEMMEIEVTQKVWFQVMKGNPSKFKKPRYCDNYDSMNDMCPDNPVERVPWNEVQVFIKKLNASLGLKGCQGRPQDPSGCYRLPTEAEWEWAVRAETKLAYFFGDNSSALGRYAIYYGNSGRRTHKVRGKRSPNKWGLYDVYGNVGEWVLDSYKSKLPGGKNPLVTIGFFRVVRGGSWNSSAGGLRSARRYRNDPRDRNFNIGFRLVKTL